MAKEKKSEAKIERVYNVPLRKQWLKAPLYRRAKRAVNALKSFLSQHMKAEPKNIKIGKYANEKIWERGIRFPPHHIKLIVKKDENGIVTAELEGAPVEEVKTEKKQKKETKKDDGTSDASNQTPEDVAEKEEKPKEEHKKKETAKKE